MFLPAPNQNKINSSAERPHGYARYKLDGCRCYTCAAAASEYNIRRERAIAYGRWHPFVAAQPVRDHINTLRACGMGLRAIATAAGVDRKRLQAITNGRPERGTPPQQRVRPEIAAAILAVEPTLDVLPGGTVIDASGTRRRIQALVAIGWSQSKIAARLGWTPANLSALLRRDRTIAATARAVRDLYEELWDQAPPEDTHRDKIAAARARNHATKCGWLPPAAWDDDLIDIPDDQLPAELARRVALMDEDELRRCASAVQKGERSPLIRAAASEYRRRYKARRKAAVPSEPLHDDVEVSA